MPAIITPDVVKTNNKFTVIFEIPTADPSKTPVPVKTVLKALHDGADSADIQFSILDDKNKTINQITIDNQYINETYLQRNMNIGGRRKLQYTKKQNKRRHIKKRKQSRRRKN